MHEQGMMRSLLQQVAQLCAAEGGKRVTHIEVEVGPLTGAEPQLLMSAFAQLQSGTPADEAELLIQETELIGHCSTCDHSVAIRNFCFRCPQCDNGMELQRGDQFTLLSISVET